MTPGCHISRPGVRGNSAMAATTLAAPPPRRHSRRRSRRSGYAARAKHLGSWAETLCDGHRPPRAARLVCQWPPARAPRPGGCSRTPRAAALARSAVAAAMPPGPLPPPPPWSLRLFRRPRLAPASIAPRCTCAAAGAKKSWHARPTTSACRGRSLAQRPMPSPTANESSSASRSESCRVRGSAVPPWPGDGASPRAVLRWKRRWRTAAVAEAPR